MECFGTKGSTGPSGSQLIAVQGLKGQQGIKAIQSNLNNEYKTVHVIVVGRRRTA